MPTSVNSGYACCRGETLAAPAVELVLDDLEQPAMHPVGQGQGFEVKLPDLIGTQLARFGNIFYHDGFQRLVVALTARPCFPARRHRHTPQDLKSS
jgi:hypothetical protein